MTPAVAHSIPPRRRRLRAGLTQLLFVLIGLGLGLAVPHIGTGPVTASQPVVDLLMAVGLGLLGATTIIFSMLFLVVQWAATTFTPRLTLFRDAPVVWRTFASALGLAAFCVTAALTMGTRTVVPVAVPAIAGLLLLTMLVMLRNLLLRAFASIQLGPVLYSVTERGRVILDSLYPAGSRAPSSAPLPPVRSTVTWPHAPAVLQQVDVKLLLGVARAADAVIVLREIPGATLRHGTALADVHEGELPASAVLRGLVAGDERTFDQDPMLAFRLLADIALRALSPAVNDPATAVQALDGIEDLLSRSAGARGGPRHIGDADGAVRVVVPLPGWEDFLRTGVDDVIHAAMGSPMVLIRVRTLLGRLRARVHPRCHALLARRLTWVEDGLSGRFSSLWQEMNEASPPAG
ncbi:DUF2254 family protein [Streptomyces sp. NPDC048258]|uniref:DUF2254 family protein n=1 Tax=Streptomyces sp. NPDC048258 TaxID=3365527 RepID=UPI003722FC70